MEDPTALIAVLKVGLILVIVIATVVIVRELVPMMQGAPSPPAERPKREEQ